MEEWESAYNKVKGHKSALLFERRSRGKRFTCRPVNIIGRRGNSVVVENAYYDIYGSVQMVERHMVSLSAICCGDAVFVFLDND